MTVDKPEHPRKVLIVEDQPDIASTLARVVHLLGHKSTIARNGATALREAPGFAPDLAIVDIGLPDMLGFEVVAGLRAMPQFADLVIVTLSGWGEATVMQRALDAGADRHVVKPASLAVLRSILQVTRTRP